ncbi:FadR/GntR family transcriptional regulator [Winogradskyella vidalii]|uniref:FadR/GntR family transcriptional regulator n=1 Tax=Winogradskyella vidalii TaxID=2615024 RepID=UPI0015C8E936|nr:FCD domain-containing protein [Winogradskyella vidalii]
MKLSPVRIKDNVEVNSLILSKLRDFIDLRRLELGDKLPSERVLSETLNVSRRSVRDAIDKLELYGLVKSVPKTGIFINTGRIAFTGVIEGMLNIGEEDFLSLVESRLMLENKSVSLAATRRTKDDLIDLEIALNAYNDKISNSEDALQEDLLFHLAIAKASKNTTIYTMMLQMIPKIITVFVKTRVCDEEGFNYEIDKHQAIFDAIKNKDAEQAVKAMDFHFELLNEYCNDFKQRQI